VGLGTSNYGALGVDRPKQGFLYDSYKNPSCFYPPGGPILANPDKTLCMVLSKQELLFLSLKGGIAVDQVRDIT
jgi:hypothetical protein